MTFLSPAFLWLLGLSVPIVALYFLRQRQQVTVLPTNFLWVQAVEDTRSAAVLRRFLKSLLLLLQLLVLALAVLALAGATASLWTQGSRRLVVALLDRSASMGVADGADGRTRLEEARALLLGAVEGLRDEDRMMLVAVDRGAEVLVPFTGEKERLRRAAAAVTVRDLPTDLGEAVLLLRGQRAATAGRTLEVLVLSDGAFPDPGTLEGAEVSFVPVGTAEENTGITDARVLRGGTGPPTLFVSVESFGGAPTDRTVALRRDGAVLAARLARATAGSQAVAVFPLENVEPGLLELHLEGSDPFPGDDRAWVVLRPDPPRRYAIYGKGNRFVSQLAALRPGMEGPPEAVADGAALRALGPLDLVFYDGEVPGDPPPSRAAVYVDCVPPAGPVTAAGALDNPPVLDWSRTHALTRHAEFSSLIVMEGLRLEGVPRSGVLVDSPQGPLLALVTLGDQEALFLPFDLAKSNFPLLLAAPLVMANAYDHFFSTRRPGDEEEVLRTGEALERRLPPGAPLEVRVPGGERATVTAGPDGRVVFRDTLRAGPYALASVAGEGLAAASLLNRRESDIRPRETVAAGGVVHEAKPEAVRTNVLLRDPLLLLALGFLLLEWVLWTRRR